MTARGVFVGIQAAVRHRLGRDNLEGVRVAIQGVGNVGHHLAKQLHAAGARLWICDINREAVDRVVDELGAVAVANEEIYDQEVDLFAPCAMGAILHDKTIPRLRAGMVAGAANNQLAETRHGTALMESGILYAPDYVINAGGVIDVCYERMAMDQTQIMQQVDGIGDTLSEIFERAEQQHRPTAELADQLAEERFS